MIKKEILNIHRYDKTNIGDYVSSPATYFDFPECNIDTIDIFSAEGPDIAKKNIIIGGGGLLDEYFKSTITHIASQKSNKKLIAWGVGQQLGTGPWLRNYKQFPYASFLEHFDLIGIRDFNFGYEWVPCASCMDKEFDVKRDPTHEIVVYSHKQHLIPLNQFPNTTNENNDFKKTIEFLASGETIITSSFHGMYWGILLGRKVIAYPFNSKFCTSKFVTPLAPLNWKRQSDILSFFSKKKYKNNYIYTKPKKWKELMNSTAPYPNALSECRQKNIEFYKKVLNILV